MRTVLSAFLIALALLAGPAPSAAETGDAQTEPEAGSMTEGTPAPPAAEDETSADDDAEQPEDIMQNFTRHRPGACPEGPPCKVED